jgi:hypothetical protein
VRRCTSTLRPSPKRTPCDSTSTSPSMIR